MAKFIETDEKCPRCNELVLKCIEEELPFYELNELKCSRIGCTYFDYHNLISVCNKN